MKKALAFAFLGWLALQGAASACTYTWTAPVTNTDGSPLTDLARYELFRDGKYLFTVQAPATSRVDTSACPVGSYTVKAVNASGVKSAPSAPYVVRTPGLTTDVSIGR